MPSNAELIKEADELAAKLGTTVETTGLKNDKLVDLVKDLRAKVTDAGTHTQADRDQYAPLVGSNHFENQYEIGDETVPLGDLVGGAFEKSGRSVEDWNSMPDEERDALIADELAARNNQAEYDKATEAAKAKKAARMENKVKKEKKPPFYVAPGKALTSKKGILSGDTSDEVKAEYLPGGKEALDSFVKSGHVLKG